jgi:hypothetical protein
MIVAKRKHFFIHPRLFIITIWGDFRNENLKRDGMNCQETEQFFFKWGFGGDFIGCGFRSDGPALARIGEGIFDAEPVGWPGDDRGGILPAKKEFPACGGGMLRSFGHGTTRNRPSRPIVRPRLQRHYESAP